jgi:hypothetical protein
MNGLAVDARHHGGQFGGREARHTAVREPRQQQLMQRLQKNRTEMLFSSLKLRIKEERF